MQKNYLVKKVKKSQKLTVFCKYGLKNHFTLKYKVKTKQTFAKTARDQKTLHA